LPSTPPPKPSVPNPSNPQSRILTPLYACLYRPPSSDAEAGGAATLLEIAQAFSPRYERHRGDLISIDVSGLTRLLGPAQTIGEEIRRDAVARGLRVHVAVAAKRMATLLMAQARPGLTVIAPGDELSALAPLPLGIMERVADAAVKGSTEVGVNGPTKVGPYAVLQRWGLRTLGDLASLPTADLVSRLGSSARVWQAIARGDDLQPLVPMLEEERFEASLDLEWPIADLEPLSFVLTRLLEPLSTRLERRDRGAAVLHVILRLVTRDPSTGSGRETCVRRLELPTPMRDVRALRTLALLDLEAHPAEAAIDRVTIVIDPTPGRVVQHTLYTCAQPTPEQLSTLLARLGALMGADRFGAPAAVDTDRPGAFAMTAFATEHDGKKPQPFENAQPLASALRRCRQPVPARVAVVDGRPVRVTSDRRGFAGGAVTRGAGPWRTSGEWWVSEKLEARSQKSEVEVQLLTSNVKLLTSGAGGAGPWDREEWDVSLSDGAVYRVFRDREADRWFIDGIVD
jgi:protein ImuB